jgi:hypothetical protein
MSFSSTSPRSSLKFSYFFIFLGGSGQAAKNTPIDLDFPLTFTTSFTLTFISDSFLRLTQGL